MRPSPKASRFGNRDSGRPDSRSFGKKRFAPSRAREGFERRGRQEAYEVVCAKCGVTTDVPFKPTSNKPVYCRDCFKKQDSMPRDDDRREKPSLNSHDIDEIHRKLNKIMEALEIDD